MKTTLNKIRSHSPCENGWKKLLKHLGKAAPDDEPLPLLTILNSNGLDDAVWCFRAIEGFDREIRLFAVFCARRVQHLMTDQRSLTALDVAERFANGLATEEELAVARGAARAAARDVAWDAAAAAARDVAWDTAAGAARDVAWDTAAGAAAAAARDVAAAAAWDAAAAAAWDAAWDAALDAERQAQEAELRRILSNT